MRHTSWLLIVLAGTGGAQWRRFGEGQPAIAPSSLARDMLTVHGAVRARVGVAPLAWSDRLAARAQDWADTLLARRQFVHRPNSIYGENLFEINGGGRIIRASGERVGRGVPQLRLPLQQMPQHVRPLHANRLERHQRSGLRSGARRRPRGLGLQLRSARQLGRQAAVLSRSQPSPSHARFAQPDRW